MKMTKPGTLIITENRVVVNGFDWAGIWNEDDLRSCLLEWLTPKLMESPIEEYEMIEIEPGVYAVGTILQ